MVAVAVRIKCRLKIRFFESSTFTYQGDDGYVVGCFKIYGSE